MLEEEKYFDPRTGLMRDGGPEGEIRLDSPGLQNNNDLAQVVLKELLQRVRALEKRVAHIEQEY